MDFLRCDVLRFSFLPNWAVPPRSPQLDVLRCSPFPEYSVSSPYNVVGLWRFHRVDFFTCDVLRFFTLSVRGSPASHCRTAPPGTEASCPEVLLRSPHLPLPPRSPTPNFQIRQRHPISVERRRRMVGRTPPSFATPPTRRGASWFDLIPVFHPSTSLRNCWSVRLASRIQTEPME